MAADWIPREVKREFCRGLLACSPEASRLKERTEALRAAIDADPERVLEYPMIWLELIRINLRQRLPVLQRHAVRAPAEDIGEPVGDVLDWADKLLARGTGKAGRKGSPRHRSSPSKDE